MAAVAFDRNRCARTRPIVPCLVCATLFASLTLLTGHAPSALQVAVVTMGYSVFVGFVYKEPMSNRRRSRWRPLLVGVGSFVCALGIAAPLILETLEANVCVVCDVSLSKQQSVR